LELEERLSKTKGVVEEGVGDADADAEGKASEKANKNASQVLLQLKALQDRLKEPGLEKKAEKDADEDGMESWRNDARNLIASLSKSTNIEAGKDVEVPNGNDVENEKRIKELTTLDGKISGMEELIGVREVLTGVDEVSFKSDVNLGNWSRFED